MAVSFEHFVDECVCLEVGAVHDQCEGVGGHWTGVVVSLGSVDASVQCPTELAVVIVGAAWR